jgi:phosphatidylinositol alpha-mannosyltransferase
VHLHEPFAPVLGYETLRQHEFASVATLHRAGGGPAYRLTKPFLRWLASRLDVVIAVSDAAATTAQREVGVAADVLYNGFETERFRRVDRVRHSPPQVLFVGRLEERKGVRTLLEAARAGGHARGWTLAIAGDGPLRPELDRLAASAWGVAMLGAVSDEKKRELLRQSEVAVCSSLGGESFGLVILEAMAAETRVVVSNIDGYRDAAGNDAVMFEPGNAASLSRAIDVALSSGSPEVLDAARARAERWSMSSLVTRYLESYDAAISRFQSSQ